MILNCFKCEREITESVDETENQPYGATNFTSHGHYGSTFYDEMTGRYLEINICDDCLRAALDKDLMFEVHPAPRPRPVSERKLYNRKYIDDYEEALQKAWGSREDNEDWVDDLLNEQN